MRTVGLAILFPILDYNSAENPILSISAQEVLARAGLDSNSAQWGLSSEQKRRG